ncbi:MAG: MtrB/PioB family decaheme-associated outer membrane protein [Syntrophaceae bacterium]
MKKTLLLVFSLLSIAAADSAFAADPAVKGEVSATGVYTDTSGNKAKFNEYRDLREFGVYGDIKLNCDSEKYFTDFNAGDFGYDTQHYNLNAGKYGDARLNLEYYEIPHNFTFDAKTPYVGAGSSNLTYPGAAPAASSANWNTFDYSIKRKNYGAGFKLDAVRPFFLDVSATREERKGTYAFGAAGTTPGGIAIELPAPIDYTTDNVQFAAGYVKNPVFLSVGFFHSNFSNDNLSFNFRNPATANTAATMDTYNLPPENSFYKVDFKGGVKLPMNSKFDVSLATARAKSDRSLFTSYVSDVTAAASNIGVQGRTGIGLSSNTFNGKIDSNSMTAALTSKPANFIDGKIFFKYYDTQNKSDTITTTDTTQTPSIFTNTPFDYRKVSYGAELGFRLPARFYLNTTYSHVKTNRTRFDIPENQDDTYGGELRWKGSKFMAARVGYERLNRTADIAAGEGLEPFIRRFDAASKNRDLYKAAVDLFPTDRLNISLTYRYRDTDYPDTTLGLQRDRRHEFAIDADYLLGKRARLFGFADYELIRYDQFQRQLPLGATTGFDPSTAPTATAFNWTAEQKDRSFGYTFGSDIFIIPDKLTLTVQHSFLKSDGSIDYTYLLGANPLPAGRNQDNIDIANWDDYKLRCWLVKLVYSVTRAVSITAGYAYENFSYSDDQYNGYVYVPATTGTNGAFLTGAYSDPSYKAHIVFLSASLRF